MSRKIHPQRGPLLCLITNRQNFQHNQSPDGGLVAGRGVDPAIEGRLRAIGNAAQAGCHLVQIREKDLPARELARFTRRAISVARPKGTFRC
jgi:thiamine monophosphate synthase